jgi:hypothetical protein
MKPTVLFLLLITLPVFAQNTGEKLSYHNIKTDASGKIESWYSDDPAVSYDHIVNIVWNFWDKMRTDMNGLAYHMNHQVWKKDYNDRRGIGGDQVAMALSSWKLYYQYSGNPQVIENMKFMADYYLAHSLSPHNYNWPDVPYPYNMLTYSGIYDGDMIMGKGYTQPDKAGSFGYELVNLYKITGKAEYLDAAVKIANTLAAHTKDGNADESPLPFRVNAETGETGALKSGDTLDIKYSYTSNWAGTMMLFTSLVSLDKGNTAEYKTAFDKILLWMKNYPVKTNKWGPFFEDVGMWSDTQINAGTFAKYILDNPELFPDWKKNSRSILDWVYKELGNDKWLKYGAKVVNEQTDYRVPGNSHTARQGSVELLYASKTGDEKSREDGIRQLNWATYMVNDDGENTYPNNETWMTDGYGDYVRHYLRAMQAYPELAPGGENHLIESSSVIKFINYNKAEITYETYDNTSAEVLRLAKKPVKVSAGDIQLNESSAGNNNWKWTQYPEGGVLVVNHNAASKIKITF